MNWTDNVLRWVERDRWPRQQRDRNKPFSPRSAEFFTRKIMPRGTPDMKNSGRDAGWYADVDWERVAKEWNR